MKYFKMLGNNELIGVITSGNFLAEDPRSGRLFTSDETLGQFVEYKAKLYRDYWMQPVPNDKRNFSIVDIREITEAQYQEIIEAIENNETPVIDDDDDFEPDIINIIPEEPDAVIEFLRNAKIKEMSNCCHTTIENGFDLILRDANHHFSLTTQDQLNLMNLQTIALTQEVIPYHADGESCVFYTVEEINKIVNAAANFKIYHTTYYNALKNYINSLDTEADISIVQYGMEIPNEFKTDVLRVLEI